MKRQLVALMVCPLLGITVSAAAQEPAGVEHWVESAGVRLYVWEKCAGTPAGRKVVILAHGSATAGKESFDLRVPGKPLANTRKTSTGSWSKRATVIAGGKTGCNARARGSSTTSTWWARRS